MASFDRHVSKRSEAAVTWHLVSCIISVKMVVVHMTLVVLDPHYRVKIWGWTHVVPA